MRLIDKHMQLLENANNATTQKERDFALSELNGFRAALEIIGEKQFVECDLYYLDKGIDRPMCCGVWLDWEPTESEK